ncbi:MAG: SDR family oxidoreductase [Acidobacteriota bacterium]
MELGLKDRVAVVAGSSQGIGKAIAEGLAAEGAMLAMCARNAAQLEQTAAQIRAQTGVKVLAVAADVTKVADIEQLVSQTLDSYGRIDILVNNAGGPPATNFENTPQEAWQQAIDLNLMTTINCCRAVVPHMRTQQWGRIINITSISVKQPVENLILSNTARAAVIGFAKSLANELGKYNILVNNICPGYTLTDRLQELVEVRAKAANIQQAEVFKRWEQDVPVGRLGRPEEVAAYAVFLASERASYINGTTVTVDGGLVKGLL